MLARVKLVIQIPAWDEEGQIAAAVRELPREVPGFTEVEVLVVDDGSTDATSRVAKEAGADHVLRLGLHRGLAFAWRAGLDRALALGADVIVSTDADRQYAAADVATLVAPILRGEAEIVVGDRGVATKADFDTAIKLGLNHPMGPFTLLDYIGLDTTLFIADAVFSETKDIRFAAPPLLRRMVSAGYLGRKSGRGFYDYSNQ